MELGKAAGGTEVGLRHWMGDWRSFPWTRLGSLAVGGSGCTTDVARSKSILRAALSCVHPSAGCELSLLCCKSLRALGRLWVLLVARDRTMGAAAVVEKLAGSRRNSVLEGQRGLGCSDSRRQ
jgi:hypothetical protein